MEENQEIIATVIIMGSEPKQDAFLFRAEAEQISST